jgi:hypothetical protein
MLLFDRENLEHRSRKPTESVLIGTATKADIWISEDGKRMHWGLSRLNPDNEDRPFRTLRPSDLGAATEALAVLSGAFAKAPNLPEKTRNALAKLSDELKSVVSRAKRGFPANESPNVTHDDSTSSTQ